MFKCGTRVNNKLTNSNGSISFEDQNDEDRPVSMFHTTKYAWQSSSLTTISLMEKRMEQE